MTKPGDEPHAESSESRPSLGIGHGTEPITFNPHLRQKDFARQIESVQLVSILAGGVSTAIALGRIHAVVSESFDPRFWLGIFAASILIPLSFFDSSSKAKAVAALLSYLLLVVSAIFAV